MGFRTLYLILLVLSYNLMSAESTTQQLTIALPARINLKVEQPVLNFSNGEPMDITTLTPQYPNIKAAIGLNASLVVDASIPHSLNVSFIPLDEASSLKWTKNDILVLTSSELTTTLLWNGSEGAKGEIIRSSGNIGFYRYYYNLTYARFFSLKNIGTLKGLLIFTLSAD